MSIYDDNGVILKGKERFYNESLTERDFNLEGCTPIYLLIDGDYVSDRAWIGMLPKIFNYLQRRNPKDIDELLNYRTKWTKTPIFSITKRTNFSPTYNGLYMNTNHTALHSMWVVQDILAYYQADFSTASFVIKRPPSAEPKEVRDLVKEENKRAFGEYLYENGYSEERTRQLIEFIESANLVLQKISKFYNDFYLLDNPLTLSNYKSRYLREIPKYYMPKDQEAAYAIAKESLDAYSTFFGNYFRNA